MNGKDTRRPTSLAPAVLCVLLTPLGAPGLGAVSTPRDISDVAGTVYRLSDKATLARGCFAPCMCPIWLTGDVRGTLVLGAPVLVGGVQQREVREVNLTAAFDDDRLSITGSGVYLVKRDGDVVLHSLELKLSIDGEQAQDFFSGFVPLLQSGDALDIPISVNGMWCFDTVIEVKASPVPEEEVLHYELAKPSSYQEGCFDLCECVLHEPQPASGRFTLVLVEDRGTVEVFAVVGAEFSVLAGGPGGGFTLAGFGTYTLIQGFAGPFHSLELMLLRDGGEAELYDHAENTEPTFPGAIHIAVDQNDRICFDRVLSLHGVAVHWIWRDGFESGDTGRWSRVGH